MHLAADDRMLFLPSGNGRPGMAALVMRRRVVDAVRKDGPGDPLMTGRRDHR